ALKDADPQRRMSGLAGLSWMGPRAKPALPLLRSAYHSPGIKDPQKAKAWRMAILSTFERMRDEAAPVVPDLLKVIANWNLDEDERQSAASALARIGQGARSALPALKKMLSDQANQGDFQKNAALKRVMEYAVQMIENPSPEPPAPFRRRK